MEGLISGFLVLADPYLLALLVMATLGGVVIGALPGLNATTGAALLLPFTLTMDPVPAISIMTAIYCSATFAGAITAILDNACGWAVRNHPDWDSESSMATLDLRIDYMEPAIPHLDVLVRSECFKLTHNIAFVKGVAYQKDVNDPIATSMATFMLGTPNAPREQEIRSGL